MTRSKFAPWLRRLHSAQTEVRLSAPAMETLAVVAYRQPVLRAEIEAIRGVQSGEVLRQLIERGLVRIAGRSDELGRPFLYGTTKQFLQVFGLRQLEALPRADVLRSNQSSTAPQEIQISSGEDTTSPSNQSQVAEEETNVKTVITTKARPAASAEHACPTLTRPHRGDRPGSQEVFDKLDEDEDEDLEDDDDDDEDDDDDLDDEPWEEVDDDDDLDEEEDEDEDWDDEDEDWDDDDEDWDDDDWDDDEDEDEDDEVEDK